MDYKDAYHALRSQHSDLQRKYHDRAEELKRTNVQLSKIENLMRAKERMEGGPPTGAALAQRAPNHPAPNPPNAPLRRHPEPRYSGDMAEI